jgi:hypothetical protein
MMRPFMQSITSMERLPSWILIQTSKEIYTQRPLLRLTELLKADANLIGERE